MAQEARSLTRHQVSQVQATRRQLLKAIGGWGAVKTIRTLTISERLAALAGIAAAIASIAGFIPGLYRDRQAVIVQSHGFDIGDLIAVAVLGLGIAWSARGSVRGRVVTIGALGYLIYSFVTYAFVIVLNPATLLYIAVLGFGGWSFLTGLAKLDVKEVETMVASRLLRRVTAGFLLVIATLFALNWLHEILASVVSGQLPPALVAVGWQMNPPYVLDLGFVIPLSVLASVRLLRHQVGGAWLAVSLLVFLPVLSVSVLMMTVFMAIDGQPLQLPLVVVFVVVIAASTTLAWLALKPRQQASADGMTHAEPVSLKRSPIQ
jgi:hypothetical protein